MQNHGTWIFTCQSSSMKTYTVYTWRYSLVLRDFWLLTFDFRVSTLDQLAYSKEPQPCRQTGNNSVKDGIRIKDGIKTQDGIKIKIKDGIRIRIKISGIKTIPTIIGISTTTQATHATPTTNSSRCNHSRHNTHQRTHFHHCHHQPQDKPHPHRHTQQPELLIRQHATIHTFSNNRLHHSTRGWFTLHLPQHPPTHHTQRHQAHNSPHQATQTAVHKQHNHKYRHHKQAPNTPLHIT